MKIVALHTDFRLYWVSRLEALSKEVELLGYEFFIIEVSGKGSPYAFAKNNISIKINWNCLFPNDRMEDLDPALAKKTIKESLDVICPDVILSGAFAFTSGATSLDWAKKNNKAVVIFDDSKKEDVPRSFITNTIKKIFYSYTDAILCPSQDWLDTYRYWGIPSKAVFYGVDVVDNQFWSIERQVAQPHSLPEKYFLCVGRQIFRKNFQMVIKAFREVADRCDYDLVFVGDGEERASLKALVDETIETRVHFFSFQEPECLSRIYKSAAFFILPSLVDTWGLVVNEAMASGLPVIVSKQCGCANTLLQNKKNGYTFDALKTEELVSIFDTVIRMQPEEIKKMGFESRKIIDEWGIDRFCQGAISAIEYAVKNKRKPFYFIGKFMLNKWNGRYNQI